MCADAWSRIWSGHALEPRISGPAAARRDAETTAQRLSTTLINLHRQLAPSSGMQGSISLVEIALDPDAGGHVADKGSLGAALVTQLVKVVLEGF